MSEDHKQRKLCPLCSKEIAAGYMWLHKNKFCPQRPERQAEINAEAMGILVPPSHVKNDASAPGIIPNNDNILNNIKPINLMEEYQNMVKVMKKKREEDDEDYQCGGCNTVFSADRQPTHCPGCGAPF